MVSNFLKLVGLSACLVVAGCTEPGEKTGVAAATGGAIGAGLGALVGSQTGSAGGGLVVGALAGSAAGGLVGNALEAQEQSIRAQDEAIERQEQFVRAQRSEIDELRRSGQDQVVRRSASPQSRGYSASSVGRSSTPASRSVPLARAASERARLQERELTTMSEREPVPPPAPIFSRTETTSGVSAPQAPLARIQPEGLPATAECKDAEVEVRKAQAAELDADRLFHFRRALRLCPDAPALHTGLGEVYLRLNREADAEFEFREALRLDPTFAGAREQLEKMTADGQRTRG